MYIEEIAEDSLLDELYSKRTEGLKRAFTNKYGLPKEFQKLHNQEEKLVSLIEKSVKNVKDYQQIKLLLNDFENGLLGELDFWESLYYKAGVVDGMQFKKELIQVRNTILNEEKINKKEEEECFFDEHIEGVIDYIETKKWKRLKQNKKYTTLVNEIEEQKRKYPKIQEFFEDELIDSATKEEIKAISKVIELQNQIFIMELEETFRLGIREGKAL